MDEKMVKVGLKSILHVINQVVELSNATTVQLVSQKNRQQGEK
jgi:hypothetical protein